jgi:SAM-dependent methyltransferase
MKTQLNKDFWNNRYINNQTGWDLGTISPPLKAYIDQLEDKAIDILIPGAGNAHELAYLLEKGFDNVTIIDIAPKLVQRLKDKYGETNAKIIEGDFFDHQGEYDLILEQTFFCAIHPSQRKSYVRKMHELLKTNGKLCGVLFNRNFEGGPPFGGSIAEYQKLFPAFFDDVTLEVCYNSHEARAKNEAWIAVKAETKP